VYYQIPEEKSLYLIFSFQFGDTMLIFSRLLQPLQTLSRAWCYGASTGFLLLGSVGTKSGRLEMRGWHWVDVHMP
jgi:hypothetical protein